MKRTLLLAAIVWFLGASAAHALVLGVKSDGDKGDLILRLSMTNEEYKAAGGLMGGTNQVVDSGIPGESDVNIALPMSAAQYDRMRTNAEKEIPIAGKSWCVTCTTGGAQLSVKAETAFNAALVGTKKCLEKSKSQDLSVAGPGSCALENP